MRKFSFFFGVLMLGSICLVAQEKISFTDLVTMDFNQLAKSKRRIEKNDKEYTRAFDQLIGDAKHALMFKPVSVMSKKDLPPSGDKHDYMSIAP